MAAKAKKFIEECKDTKNNELEIVDKGINTLEIHGLCRFFFNKTVQE
jgi:hypothetical protein